VCRWCKSGLGVTKDDMGAVTCPRGFVEDRRGGGRADDRVAALKHLTSACAAIDAVRVRGDSCGGEVTCVVRNPPIGLGSPVFDKLEAELAKAAMSLPASKVPFHVLSCQSCGPSTFDMCALHCPLPSDSAPVSLASVWGAASVASKVWIVWLAGLCHWQWI
jgi:hypothetical protein